MHTITKNGERAISKSAQSRAYIFIFNFLTPAKLNVCAWNCTSAVKLAVRVSVYWQLS